MIKNINDLISIFVLFLMLVFSLRIFVWAFINKEDNGAKVNKWQLIKDYNDNTEE